MTAPRRSGGRSAHAIVDLFDFLVGLPHDHDSCIYMPAYLRIAIFSIYIFPLIIFLDPSRHVFFFLKQDPSRHIAAHRKDVGRPNIALHLRHELGFPF